MVGEGGVDEGAQGTSLRWPVSPGCPVSSKVVCSSARRRPRRRRSGSHGFSASSCATKAAVAWEARRREGKGVMKDGERRGQGRASEAVARTRDPFTFVDAPPVSTVTKCLSSAWSHLRVITSAKCSSSLSSASPGWCLQWTVWDRGAKDRGA